MGSTDSPDGWIKYIVKSGKGHLNEKTFHTIIETMKHGYAIRSGLGLVFESTDPDRPVAPDLITFEYSSIIGIDRMFYK